MVAIRYMPRQVSGVAVMRVPGLRTLAIACREKDIITVTPSALLRTGALDGQPIWIEDGHVRLADGGIVAGGKLTILLPTSNKTDTRTFDTMAEAVRYSIQDADIIFKTAAEMIVFPFQDRMTLAALCRSVQVNMQQQGGS